MDVENALNDGKPVGDELCRLCANTDKQFIPIFQEEGMEHNISEQIKKYLPIIRVTKVDKLPLQVCYQCTSTLLSWHNFFEQCRVADNRLREILSVNVEFNKDDESCHDYADDFRDDFDDQPSLSDRICDIPEKSVHFDLTVNEAMDSSDSVNKDSKSVTENADDSRCALAGPCDMRKSYPRHVSLTSLASTASLNCATSGYAVVQAPSWDSHVPRGEQPASWPSSANQSAGATCGQSSSVGNATAGCPKATNLRCGVCFAEFGYWNALRSHQKTCAENVAAEGAGAITGNTISHVTAGGSKTTDLDGALRPADGTDSPEETGEPDDASERFDRMAVMIDGRCRFRCDWCGHVAAGLASMRRHYTEHTGERRFACEQCGARYRLLNSLRKHIMRAHERVRQYGCAECGRQFDEKGELRAHRKAHAAQRRFACDECDATFGYRASLKAHLRTHASEPAFRCAVCAKSFTHSSSFQLHQKRHRGQLDYRCDVCDKAFLDKLQLRRHLAVHSDERPFACETCGATFKLNKYLQSHRRTHRRKKAARSGQPADDDSSDE